MEFIIRNYFITDPGCINVHMDADSEEYRVLAHYGNDEVFKQFVREGKDIHSATAAEIFNVPYDSVTPDLRSKGKTTNFALVYGQGNCKFAISIGYKIDDKLYKIGSSVLYKTFQPWKLPPYCNDQSLNTVKQLPCYTQANDETKRGIEYFFDPYVMEGIAMAADIKKKYFGKFPGIKQFIKDASAAGSSRGYVKTWTGRRRHFKDPKNDGYKAPNSIIQGGCGDIIKKKLWQVNQFLKPHKTRIINNVHDELATRHPINRKEILLIPQINEILCDLPFRVPISWGIEWSYKWGEKRKFTTIEALMEELHI